MPLCVVMVMMHCHGNVVVQVVVTQVQFEDGQMISASKWGQSQTQDKLELSPEEMVISDKLKVWVCVHVEGCACGVCACGVCACGVCACVCVCISVCGTVHVCEYWCCVCLNVCKASWDHGPVIK